ncbi:NAD(P)H-dependent glycerol-3-phosphate dehydrogenase [Candidatus Nitronereus thalassa]|uniref:Glycerol-3-phosphate dehydrogenase [NAD(P)+] n=1 Tax=Candidatus Nitronereus thalassa TaxID=3020898 RepID=A0ABU3K9J5_9BACT|nr:NAD(P)H-dependent glycerol-3-phosphate dehydrogenase [Candidatus Nitronereus thalassa]MDT7043066.1 NAD(P)-dependent glycerol-3-phosphate dehydrogenase [Candidatus Nitronereus thalassa]
MTTPHSTIRRVAVIGAGAWGTCLARHLAENHLTVKLWAFESEVVEAVNMTHENTVFLPGVSLPKSLIATTSFSEALSNADLLIFAVPSHVMRMVLKNMKPSLSKAAPIVVATKGIEEDTLKFMTQVLQEILPSDWAYGITVLTGPSFAAEVCQSKPTTILLAGQDPALTTQLQSVFMTSVFRVYTGSDVLGAQLGGALKNVMAIAAGVVDGLQLGGNARAALITRGLAEIIRLGVALGADVHTLYGLSGLGDLVLTCTGSLSRNYTVGVQLGQGKSLERILEDTITVAEGIRTTRAAMSLATQLHVEMPIVQGIHALLFEGKSARQAVEELMSRSAKEETSHTLAHPPSSSSEFPAGRS